MSAKLAKLLKDAFVAEQNGKKGRITNHFQCSGVRLQSKKKEILPSSTMMIVFSSLQESAQIKNEVNKMLQELLKNFAIISSLQLEFQMGMTVLGGKAGKSIIIDAMGLLTGGRGSSDYIRQGANKCTLERTFNAESQELKKLLEELVLKQKKDSLVILEIYFRFW